LTFKFGLMNRSQYSKLSYKFNFIIFESIDNVIYRYRLF
jgi:hypothetical protein